ncbi:hypothetical protein MKEN_00340600 [Mycena kentingensis (nom. inval.)]|nr:hypothetical protein MKEN_00340600 [Mycena kentingensis (nom. inval.)]
MLEDVESSVLNPLNDASPDDHQHPNAAVAEIVQQLTKTIDDASNAPPVVIEAPTDAEEGAGALSSVDSEIVAPQEPPADEQPAMLSETLPEVTPVVQASLVDDEDEADEPTQTPDSATLNKADPISRPFTPSYSVTRQGPGTPSADEELSEPIVTVSEVEDPIPEVQPPRDDAPRPASPWTQSYSVVVQGSPNTTPIELEPADATLPAEEPERPKSPTDADVPEQQSAENVDATEIVEDAESETAPEAIDAAPAEVKDAGTRLEIIASDSAADALLDTTASTIGEEDATLAVENDQATETKPQEAEPDKGSEITATEAAEPSAAEGNDFAKASLEVEGEKDRDESALVPEAETENTDIATKKLEPVEVDETTQPETEAVDPAAETTLGDAAGEIVKDEPVDQPSSEEVAGPAVIAESVPEHEETVAFAIEEGAVSEPVIVNLAESQQPAADKDSNEEEVREPVSDEEVAPVPAVEDEIAVEAADEDIIVQTEADVQRGVVNETEPRNELEAVESQEEAEEKTILNPQTDESLGATTVVVPTENSEASASEQEIPSVSEPPDEAASESATVGVISEVEAAEEEVAEAPVAESQDTPGVQAETVIEEATALETDVPEVADAEAVSFEEAVPIVEEQSAAEPVSESGLDGRSDVIAPTTVEAVEVQAPSEPVESSAERAIDESPEDVEVEEQTIEEVAPEQPANAHASEIEEAETIPLVSTDDAMPVKVDAAEVEAPTEPAQLSEQPLVADTTVVETAAQEEEAAVVESEEHAPVAVSEPHVSVSNEEEEVASREFVAADTSEVEELSESQDPASSVADAPESTSISTSEEVEKAMVEVESENSASVEAETQDNATATELEPEQPTTEPAVEELSVSETIVDTPAEENVGSVDEDNLAEEPEKVQEDAQALAEEVLATDVVQQREESEPTVMDAARVGESEAEADVVVAQGDAATTEVESTDVQEPVEVQLVETEVVHEEQVQTQPEPAAEESKPSVESIAAEEPAAQLESDSIELVEHEQDILATSSNVPTVIEEAAELEAEAVAESMINVDEVVPEGRLTPIERPWTPSYSVVSIGPGVTVSEDAPEPTVTISESSSERVASRPTTPWTESYSVVVQGSPRAPDAELEPTADVETEPSVSQEVLTEVAAPIEQVGFEETLATFAPEAPKQPEVAAEAPEHVPPTVAVEANVESAAVDPEQTAPVVEEHPLTDEQPELAIDEAVASSEQPAVNEIAIVTEETLSPAAEPIQRPVSPWTGSYSVTTQGPGTLQEPEVPTTVVTVSEAPEEEVPSEAVDVPARPWTPSYSVSQGSPLSPSTDLVVADEVPVTLAKAIDVIAPTEDPVIFTDIRADDDLVPNETGTIDVVQEATEEPSEPGADEEVAPAALVLLQNVAPDTKDATSAEEAMTVNAPSTERALTPEAKEPIERSSTPSYGSYAVTRQGPGVEATEEAAPVHPTVLVSEVEPESNEVKWCCFIMAGGALNVEQAHSVEENPRPPSPWTQSYSVVTQGSPVASPIEMVAATEDSPAVVDPSTLQDPDVEEDTGSPDLASDAVVAALVESGVAGETNAPLEPNKDVVPKSVETTTESTPVASTHPLPELLTSPQAFPVANKAGEDETEDFVPPLSPRSRLESTASSLFFPGGWFSKMPEGRASLEVAAGEFTPSKPTAESIPSPGTEEAPAVAGEPPAPSPTESEEKKGKCRYGHIPQTTTLLHGQRSLVKRISDELSNPGVVLEDHQGHEQCRPIAFPATEQCAHVLESCSLPPTFLSIPYLPHYYCTETTLRPLVFCGFVLWLIFLARISASDFFSPNLATIAQVLGLDENVAGVTFLAFGNGSPDVFSTFSAMRADSGSLAIGELLGAASFIVSCVVGSMCIIKPFQLHRANSFLRDVGFMFAAVTLLLVILWDGNIRFWECAAMIALYVVYVAAVVAGSWWERRQERKRAHEAMVRSEYDDSPRSPSYGFPDPYRDEPGLQVEPPVVTLAAPSPTRARAISAPVAPPRLQTDLPRRPHSRTPSPSPSFGAMPSFSLVGALEFRSVVASLQHEAAATTLSIFDSPYTPYAGGHYSVRGSRSRTSSRDVNSWDVALGLPLDERPRVVLTPALSEDPEDFLDGTTAATDGRSSARDGSAPTISRTVSEGDAESQHYQPLTRRQRVLAVVAETYHTLFPSLHNFASKTILGQIASLFAAPAVLLLTLTLPVVVTPYHSAHHSREKTPREEPNLIDFEEEGIERVLVAEEEVQEEMHGIAYNQWLTVAQCICGPLFCAMVLFGGNEHQPLALLCAGVVGAVVSVLVGLFGADGQSPTFRMARCSMGFFVAVVWIMAIADEVVKVLQTFGFIFGLSDAIIGLTIFAIGNSLADLVANMTVAVFAPIMGFSACFGGPMLNILLGVGLSGLYITQQTSQPYELHFGKTLIVSTVGPSELKLQISITTDKTVLELKQAIADKSDVEADRQRLIYSGRVLKDEDLLSVYKIQTSHTIHMVKGAARSGAASSSSQPAAPQQLPTMQAGQNPHDPLTQLNSHLGFGAMAGLNPFADMGLNPNDPNMMQGMMNNPAFLQQMSNMMSNPEVMNQILASSPQMAQLPPEARQMMQSEHFRQMVSSPENLQRMFQMANLFNGGGLGGLGGAGGNAFPAPGIPGAPAAAATQAGQQQQPTPFSNLFGGGGGGGGFGGPAPDPGLLAALLGLPAPGAAATPATGGTPPAAGADPAAAALRQQLLAAYQPAPADARPAEERFQVQLQQLQDMGFTNASQNVRALLATGGNVHSAIEYILGGGGLSWTTPSRLQLCSRHHHGAVHRRVMAASPTASTITVQTRHQSNVLARLQALFPTSPTTTNGPIPPPLSPGPANHYGEKGPKPSVSLKIRMVSWNMHSSLPKGDLTHLFGRVPLYRPSELSESGIPQFPVEDQHPYHLIVVAGQECPSVSGIPLGIGAGFRLKDRDRESDRDSTRHKDDSKEASPHEALGWTGMVEDWLCHGGQHAPATPADISAPKPLSARGTPVERKGPYQLLVKERLMGLYMAIYIHRDLRPLVKGMSRSVVTTGLLRGRVGNKGGVGISLSIGGTTLLFINAHLAAHENKVHHRLADLAKIKAELSVEDFLPPDDPRVMAEDIVDKFDYSFLLGDLNFRLDISRLHADWLISREDYAQALTFDQLRNLMASGTSFVGWQEAEIRFAPTFKYDVLRTVKAKRRGSKLDRLRDRPRQLTEVDEHVDETVQEILDAEDADSDRDGEGGEAASLASSVWTSMHSKHATDDDYFQPSPSSNAMSSLSSPGSRISISVAAHRAKSKWMALLSPASPNAPSKWLKARHASLFPPSPSTESKMSRHRSLDAPVLPPSLKRLGSTKSSAQSDEEDERGDDKGIYDTSYKKRVPSKHALGDRARKLDQGILITRFELPFNIWCGTCDNHIGMGVRYNAEKKKIGNYYSTPIFSFRCKCHLCDGWFEIQTDPKNTRYVVVSGARQKYEEWDAEENGTFAKHDTGIEGQAAAPDPLASLEKTADTQKGLVRVQDRLDELQEASDKYNSDPFTLSSRLRKQFRTDKKVETAKKQADDKIKDRYGLPEDLRLVADNDEAVQTAKEEWERGRRERELKERQKQRTLAVEVTSLPSAAGPIRQPKRGKPISNPVASLRAKLLENTARNSNPFGRPRT